MEPMLILKSAHIGIGLAKFSATMPKLSAIEAELTQLRRQSDQLITREVLGAYEALVDACASNHPETIQSRLRFAEESLLRNTKLDSSLETSGRSNRTWMLLAHLGLASISAIREDLSTAAIHLLQCFVVDSRAARSEYLGDLYQDVLEPRMAEPLGLAFAKRSHSLSLSGLGGLGLLLPEMARDYECRKLALELIENIRNSD